MEDEMSWRITKRNYKNGRLILICATVLALALLTPARAAVIISGSTGTIPFQNLSAPTPSGPDEARFNLVRMNGRNSYGLLYEVRKDSETLDAIIAKYMVGNLVGNAERRMFKDIVVRANNFPGIALLRPFEFKRGDRILLPTVYFDTYRFPFDSQERPRISLRFGRRYDSVSKGRLMHDGIDIPKPYGTAVYPARSGRVLHADWNEEYGQLVIIKHNNGETTRYGHLSKIMVKPGDLVQRKTVIGLVGSTGISIEPQLHFEVRDRNGHPVNPLTKIGRP